MNLVDIGLHCNKIASLINFVYLDTLCNIQESSFIYCSGDLQINK